MKKYLCFMFCFAMIFSIALTGCESDSTTSPKEDLDEKLFGVWVFVDQDNNEMSWNFKSNGTCIQDIYDIETNWKWKIENEKLKLWVENGTPHYKTYKIEGNLLYFYVDEYNTWGIPFQKR